MDTRSCRIGQGPVGTAAVELSEIEVPESLGDEALGRLAAAFKPMLDPDDDVAEALRGAASSIAADLKVLAEKERRVRQSVDAATTSAKQIVDYTLPPYWPFMLGASILMALSGFLVMDRPQWRLPFIVSVGVAMLGLLGHYAWRLARRARVIRPLQDGFEEQEGSARSLFEEIGAMEEALRAAGFDLETETFLPFAPAVERLATPGPEGDAERARLTRFVTGDTERQSPDPS